MNAASRTAGNAITNQDFLQNMKRRDICVLTKVRTLIQQMQDAVKLTIRLSARNDITIGLGSSFIQFELEFCRGERD